MQKENIVLRTRLDDAEDRSRRDNLVFFGMADTISETWAQTEQTILNIFRQSLNLQVPDEAIVRAHRIGTFCQSKCRPVIVKFASYKLKDNVLLSRAPLKAKRITVSEDYSIGTRTARKRLIDFAKEKGGTFKLRHNRIHINNKCYAFDPTTENVYEVGPSTTPVVTVPHNSLPTNDSSQPSTSQ